MQRHISNLFLSWLIYIPDASAQVLAEPGDLYGLVEEMNGELFVDHVTAVWRPLKRPEIASYLVKFSLEPQPGSKAFLEQTVTHEAGKAWLESKNSIDTKSIYDYQRIYISIQAKDRGGNLIDYGATSALFGERPSSRGDVDGNQAVDLTDAILLLTHLFLGAYTPSPYSLSYASDADGSKILDLTDPVFILLWQYAGGSPPREEDLKSDRPRMLFGLFYGDDRVEPMYKTMDHVHALEDWQGKKNAVINLFSNWTPEAGNDLFGFQLTNIWENGSVPMITWEPRTSFTAKDKNIEDTVANTPAHDAAIRSWAGRLKAWLKGKDNKFGDEGGAAVLNAEAAKDNRRVYLRLAHEMNGWWSDWNAVNDLDIMTLRNTPDDYKKMWIKIHHILVNDFHLDRNHVQWVWCVNNVDADFDDGQVIYPAETYYPGGAYVDWLSIDGYNWGYSQPWTDSWNDPPIVFDDDRVENRMLRRLRVLDSTKPICIAEYGCTSVDAKSPVEHISLDKKQQWITAAMNYFLTSKIKMVIYFNYDKETDWAIFGGKFGRGDELSGTRRGYTTFKNALRSDLFIPGSTALPRRLTDEQFWGE